MLTAYFAAGGSDRLAALLKVAQPDAYDDADASEVVTNDHATSDDADAHHPMEGTA